MIPSNLTPMKAGLVCQACPRFELVAVGFAVGVGMTVLIVLFWWMMNRDR
jgi:hypothetical protein